MIHLLHKKNTDLTFLIVVMTNILISLMLTILI